MQSTHTLQFNSSKMTKHHCPADSLLTWRRCHNKSRCWLGRRRLCLEERSEIWWRAEGGTCSTRSGREPAGRAEQPSTSTQCKNHKLELSHGRNRDGFLSYLFAPWCGRVVTVIGQVSCEDVELAGDHPPRVTHFYLVLRGQEHPELAGREGQRRHYRVLPRPQSAQRAVRNLKETEEDDLEKHKRYKCSAVSFLIQLKAPYTVWTSCVHKELSEAARKCIVTFINNNCTNTR